MAKPLFHALPYNASLLDLESAHDLARQRYDVLGRARPLEAAWFRARDTYRPSALDRASTLAYNAATRAYLDSNEPQAFLAAENELLPFQGRYAHAVRMRYLAMDIHHTSANEGVNAFWDTHRKALEVLFQQLTLGRSDATKRLLDFYWGLQTDTDWYCFFICVANRLAPAQLLTLAPYVRHAMQPFFNRALFTRFALSYSHGRPFQLPTDRAQR